MAAPASRNIPADGPRPFPRLLDLKRAAAPLVDVTWLVNGFAYRNRTWSPEAWDRLPPAERPALVQRAGDYVVGLEPA